MQYAASLKGGKNDNFLCKNIYSFLIFAQNAQNIDCGCMLEYPQSMF